VISFHSRFRVRHAINRRADVGQTAECTVQSVDLTDETHNVRRLVDMETSR